MGKFAPADPRDEMALIRAMQDPTIADNPYLWVMFAFPWGQPNTPLEKYTGPRRWQKRVLLRIARHIADGRASMKDHKLPPVFKLARASGRGIGKSTLLAWLVLWLMSTRFGASVIVSANNENQLKSATWGEIGKWLTMSINAHWWEFNSTRISPDRWFADALARDLKISSQYYYAEAKLWKEENPDAYAGPHNPHGLMVIFDEASGIPTPIWTVTEGFFTEEILDRYWFAFSNPRRASGAFFDRFNGGGLGWDTECIDSRDVEGTDKAVYQTLVDQYGEEHDAVRVEVRGMFPRTGDRQFIGRGLITAAVQRENQPDEMAALIMAVDVARYGTNKSVIRFRQGRNGRVVPPVKLARNSVVELADRVMQCIQDYRPDAVVIDGGGVGGGVVDILVANKYKVHDFNGGAQAHDRKRYKNRRAECWAILKDWLEKGTLDPDDELVADLLKPEYTLDENTGQMLLESKAHMEDVRRLSSPDDGDAFAMTFAVTPARRDMATYRRHHVRVAKDVDYCVLG